jgi:uncharacterized DUF497 family protein
VVVQGEQAEFEWDELNVGHFARHDVSPAEIEQALGREPLIMDVRDEGGEERWYALGVTQNLRVLFMVYTYRGKRIRSITARDATKKLREIYFHSTSL